MKAQRLGLSLVLVISAYILYNITYALASTPAGNIADKIGARKVFLIGIFIYTLVYAGFAFNRLPIFVWILFAIYGFYIALTDGISKAMIGEMTTTDKAGTVYGIFYTVTSVATLLASIIGGFLWSLITPQATFLFAAICAIISLFLLIRQK